MYDLGFPLDPGCLSRPRASPWLRRLLRNNSQVFRRNKPTMVATWWRGDRPHYECFVWGTYLFAVSKMVPVHPFFWAMMIHYNKVCCSKIDHFLFEHVDIYIYTRTVQLLLLLLSFTDPCANLESGWASLAAQHEEKHSSNRTTWKSSLPETHTSNQSSGKRSNLFSL